MPKIFNFQSHFIVVAGPNGAGKSLTSQNILKPYGIKAFDWDKEFDLKWKNFDYDPAVVEGVRAAVNAGFNVHLEAAFNQQKSVSYETNFHSSYNFELARKARKIGYCNSLYFLAITDPELAIERVRQRVSKGGHDVSEPIIRERLKKGLKHLDQAIEFYDNIFLYNSADTFQLQLVINDRILVHQSKNLNTIIMEYLPQIKSLIKNSL